MQTIWNIGWFIGGIIQGLRDTYMFFRHEAKPIKVIMLLAILGIWFVLLRHVVLHGPDEIQVFIERIIAWWNYQPPGLSGMMQAY